jgi:hypothetical protein
MREDMSAIFAAWVQAVGSVVAILVAVYVSWRQRRDQIAEQARQDREQLRRLSAGFRAEIVAAGKTADRREFAIKHTFQMVEQARRSGVAVAEPGPIQPGSLTLSDATIYKQLSAELGRFSPGLITNIVTFYSLVFDTKRMTDGAPKAMQAYEELLGSLPRFKMNAAILVVTLDKFEAAGFSANADLSLKPDELRKMAEATGYPLDEVLKERGLTLKH